MDQTGWEEALRRIDAEREARTGELDLAGLGLRELPPAISELTWLEALDLGGLAHGPKLSSRTWFLHWERELWPNRGSVNPLTDLSPLAPLTNLRQLSLSGTDVTALDAIADLTALTRLDLLGSTATDIGGLSAMQALQALDLSGTPLTAFELLGRLTGLSSVDMNRTAIRDLRVLGSLSLERLAVAGTRIEALAGDWCRLTWLDCSNTRVDDLTPLANAQQLVTLRCNDTSIHSLEPLAQLTELRELRVERTKIADLSPLAGLSKLEQLSCDETRLVSIDPVLDLPFLQELRCADTHIESIEGIARCPGLKSLSFDRTRVCDLTPLASLRSLESVSFSQTSVSDVGALAGAKRLRWVSLDQTHVSDLEPLRSATALESLYCYEAPVTDLEPVASHPGLSLLWLGGCRLRDLPLGLIGHPHLKLLWVDHVDGYPPEIFASGNCLLALRAHVADLDGGAEPYRTTKVIVLGNGRVGKTQLCRKLRGLDYDPSIPSTHGIVIDTADFDDDETLNLWDFGGQDIYHGAHALFMRTRAVFVIAWHPEFEDTPTHEYQGMTFRNRPLAYWLAFVQAMSAPGSPVIVVQTRCDGRGHVVKRPPIPDDFFDEMDCRVVQYSAQTDFGRRRLDGEIADAIEAIRERDGVASIGAGRARVIEALQGLREADRERPAAERESRVLDMQRFVAICEAAEGVSSPEMLLHYLHQCGLLFYDPERFGDRILLDISWALEAIYTLFDRETAWRQLQGSDGRFTAALLAATVWREVEPEARALFLRLMESCGICFRHGQPGAVDVETEYVAPDLLPDRTRVARHLRGRMVGERRRLVQRYDFLHPGLFRGLMSRVGGKAGDEGVYWQHGLWVYAPTSDTQVQIEVSPDDGEGYGGRIEIALIGDDGALADWLREQLAELSRRFGLMALSPEVDTLPVGEREGLPRVVDGDICPPPEARPPAFGPMPPEAIERPEPKRRRVYVSYARVEGAGLTKALHGALTAAGLEVVYDEVGTGFGDSIGAFMDALIEGDRIIVVLGDHSLRSPFCMYELYGIWQRARQDPKRFADKVLPLLLPGTRIDTMTARVAHAQHWLDAYEEARVLVGEHIEAIAPGDLADFKRMQTYHLHVGDMLRALADKLMPRDLEALAADDFAALRALLGEGLD